MKTAGRWTALVLCLLLLAARPAAALAADTGMSAQEIAEDILSRLNAAAVTSESVAVEFMKLLDGDGIAYSAYGVLDTGDYLLEIYCPCGSGGEYDVFLFIDEGGAAFAAFEQDLKTFDGERFSDALRIINELNRRSRFVTFKVRTDENTFSAECHGVLLGNAAQSARLLYRTFEQLPPALDDARERLEAVFPGPAETIGASDLAGTWRFASMILKRAQGEEVTLTAEDLGTDELVVLTLREDGTAELKDPGNMILNETPLTGTWIGRGDDVLLELGETVRLTRTDENTLLFASSGESGVSLALTRREEDRGSDANERLEAALSRASECLRYNSYSRSGLIERLESDGFTAQEAAYAAENCGADWAEQALRSGKSYLNSSAFSHNGLIGQLEYEGFTNGEAAYAADTLFAGVGESGRTIGEENALREAKSFLFYIPCSCSFLTSVLTNMEYTPDEVAYAVENCGADWAEQAFLCAEKYLPDYPTWEELSKRLKWDDFTDEEIAYAVDRLGVK